MTLAAAHRKQGRGCPLCGETALEAILTRECVPVLSNRTYDTAEAAKAAPTGNLAIVACATCGFIFNCAFDPALVTYDQTYENDQARSPIFAAHMRLVADRILVRTAADDTARIVEIGCGQGLFLAMLTERAGAPFTATGFDPAFRGGPLPARIRIERRLFDRHAALELRGAPHAIVSRHVIEHVPDPIAFLSAIREALPRSWDGVLFLETPSVEWILEKPAPHDFFYEHCNYFSEGALRYCLAASGFEVLEIQRLFGEQYFLVEAVAQPHPARTPELPRPDTRLSGATCLQEQEEHLTAIWQDRFKWVKKAGKEVVVWGAGAKGINFAQLMDPTSERITCLVDINPAKQGRFIPVTGHRVIGPAEMSLRSSTIVVMNPEYRKEIEAQLDRLGIASDILVA